MKRLVIGLTGGIAAGKSLALRQFSRCGARTISLDDIAREQARKGGPAYRAIVSAFGPAVLGAGGEIDRRGLGRRVFVSTAARRKLERLTHPLILREMRRRIKKEGGGRRPCVVDVPLLFEAGLEKEFDLTMLIAAKKKVQMSRLMKRDRLSRSEAGSRIAAQMPLSAKERRADVVVSNAGPRKNFRRSITQYYRALELIGA